MSLGTPSVAVRATPGVHSDPVRQVVANSGNATFASVELAATPWRAAGGGSAAVLPASATEWSAAGPGGGYAALAAGPAVAVRGLEGGDTAPLWFRMNLAPFGGGDLQGGDTIVQHVTYSAECRPP